MRTLYRHLYRLLLRLHPAPFRSEFARDMALDFEDALATYGFARLFLDATRSLARQWTTDLISPSVAPAQTPAHPLLAGNYAQILDQPLRPLELARGLLASATLLALCLFAFHVNPGDPPPSPPAPGGCIALGSRHRLRRLHDRNRVPHKASPVRPTTAPERARTGKWQNVVRRCLSVKAEHRLDLRTSQL